MGCKFWKKAQAPMRKSQRSSRDPKLQLGKELPISIWNCANCRPTRAARSATVTSRIRVRFHYPTMIIDFRNIKCRKGSKRPDFCKRVSIHGAILKFIRGKSCLYNHICIQRSCFFWMIRVSLTFVWLRIQSFASQSSASVEVISR